METLWILGVGRFGLSAFHRLSKKHKDWHFVLVDLVEETLLNCAGPHVTPVHGDAVAYLTDHLVPSAKVSWIIPCLPLHLAWEWCHRKLGPEHLAQIPLPPGIEPLLSNPMKGTEGHLYVSHADFICPATCSEPDLLCTATNKPRKKDMFQQLAALAYQDFVPIVLESHQLGPGIGGFRPEQLNIFLDQVRHRKGPLLLCTACRCHGVITGAQYGPKPYLTGRGRRC